MFWSFVSRTNSLYNVNMDKIRPSKILHAFYCPCLFPQYIFFQQILEFEIHEQGTYIIDRKRIKET